MSNNEEKSKRARAPNFTPDEKRTILELVRLYKNQVENKKTDSASKGSKNDAWTLITNSFNAQCPSGSIPRTCENLKNFYDNQKRIARKYVANEKKEIKKTGGGIRDTQDDKKDETDESLTELTISIMNKKTVYGLPSRLDGDANHIFIEPDSEILELVNNADIPSLADFPTPTPTNQQQYNTPDTTFAKPQEQPKTPLTNNIHSQSVIKDPTWLSRRRPATNTSQNLSKAYEDLSNAKLELTKLQLDLLKKQNEATSMHETEKSRLERELLHTQMLYWKNKDERELELFNLQKQVLLGQLQRIH